MPALVCNVLNVEWTRVLFSPYSKPSRPDTLIYSPFTTLYCKLAFKSETSCVAVTICFSFPAICSDCCWYWVNSESLIAAPLLSSKSLVFSSPTSFVIPFLFPLSLILAVVSFINSLFWKMESISLANWPFNWLLLDSYVERMCCSSFSAIIPFRTLLRASLSSANSCI